jgi:Mrp family chromosome partitioning ATPase
MPANGHSRLHRMGEEEITKLVQQVFRVPDPPHVVVFSSVGHGDGTSWTCASAALSLATQVTGSICAVDANLRTPSLHRYFGVENRAGLAEAVESAGPIRDFARQVGGSSLWILPSGTLKSATASPLGSEALRARIAELRSEFTYVLIDAPPANLYADAITLGRLSDGILLVLQSNATRRESALKVKESFESAKVRLLGAVLNKRTFPIPQGLYDRL